MVYNNNEIIEILSFHKHMYYVFIYYTSNESIRIYFKNQTHLNYVMIKLLVRWK